MGGHGYVGRLEPGDRPPAALCAPAPNFSLPTPLPTCKACRDALRPREASIDGRYPANRPRDCCGRLGPTGKTLGSLVRLANCLGALSGATGAVVWYVSAGPFYGAPGAAGTALAGLRCVREERTCMDAG